MPPLYKRYIPPKPSAVAESRQSNAPAPKIHQQAGRAINDEPKKRKRERTDDEVAERKAKKLRKKGVDASTESANFIEDAVSGAEIPRKSTTKQSTASSSEPRSEFAHIKDAKKRHKLEKEARKERIAAEKASTDNRPNGKPDHELASRSAATAIEDSPRLPNGDANRSTGFTSPIRESKKKKGQKREGDAEVIEDARTDQDRSVPAGEILELATKKDKKSKRNDRSKADEISRMEPEKLPPPEVEAISQPKKRRHKLEAALREPAQPTTSQEADYDESHLKNHSGILKKYQKSAELSQSAPRPASKEKDPDMPEPTVLDFGPLPQPDPAPMEKFVPDDSAVPAWLAKPTIISSDEREPFTSLKLNEKTTKHLEKLGFNDVLPVQKALIPMLLHPGSAGSQFFPGTESILPDIAVGAPTGSGKTIAYLLPIIEAFKLKPRIGEDRLRALVVVPTRELVQQVAAVAESLAKGSSIKIGMSTGFGSFKDEQVKLIKRDRQYDPEGYRALIAKADQRNYPPDEGTEEFDAFLDELESEDSRTKQEIQDTVRCLIDHVPTYRSAVDILVATPGRLLDHVKSTLGFSLGHLEFLVLDEADKLLDLQYDGFLETVNAELERPRSIDDQDPRERYLRAQGMWQEHKERRIRKVVLSATMTKDISKLVALKLKRPRMIVIRGFEGDLMNDDDGDAVKQSDGQFELPPTLREFCVPVGDGSEKPLFLTELLRTRILDLNDRNFHSADMDDDSTNDSDESSGDSSSDSGSDSSTSSPSTDSDSSSDSDGDSSSVGDDAEEKLPGTSMHPSRTAMLHSVSAPTILIFTSSNESAGRLTHLLKALLPSDSERNIHTMIRTSSKPRMPSNATEPVIVVSTDRAGRGLDSLGNRHITHVIQYDVPRSLTTYIHRVGRTARAGKGGEAWTLYAHSQARWFFKEVAGGDVKGVKRAGNVEKVKIKVEDEAMRERLADVVEEVRGKVLGGRKG